MDMMMSIAATGVAMAQTQLEQAASISIMRKSMDATEQQAAQLLEMLPPSNNLIDVYA